MRNVNSWLNSTFVNFAITFRHSGKRYMPPLPSSADSMYLPHYLRRRAILFKTYHGVRGRQYKGMLLDVCVEI